MCAFISPVPLLRNSASRFGATRKLKSTQVARRCRVPLALSTQRYARPFSETLQEAVSSAATAKIPTLVQSCLEHPPLDVSLWRAALSVCITEKEFDAAAHVLRLGVRSYPPALLPRRTFVRPLLALAQASRWRVLFSWLDTLRKLGPESAPDERLLVSLANAAVDRRSYRAALALLALVDRYGLRLGPVGYSVLLKAHGRSKNTAEVRRVVAELRHGRVHIDSVLLNSAIDALVRCDDLRAACDLVDDEKYASLIDVASFNTIIKGLAGRGLLDEAFDAASKMGQAGLEANDVTRNTLLSACVSVGDFDRAWKLADSVATAGAENDGLRGGEGKVTETGTSSASANLTGPNVPKQLTIALTSLVAGLAEKGRVADALALLNDMSERNAPPSDITYSALIAACFRRGAPDDAIKVYKSIPRPPPDSGETGLRTLAVCNSLICGLCHVGDEYHVKLAAAFVNDMNAKASADHREIQGIVRPNVESYNALLDGFVHCGAFDRAEHFLSVMEQNHCRPNIASFTIMMKGYGDARNYGMAKKMFREVSRRGIRPDRIALNAFISICARSGDISAALHVLEYMERKGGGISAGIYSYTPLVAAYLRASDIESAWSIYERMRHKQVRLNSYLVELLTSSTVTLATAIMRGQEKRMTVDAVAVTGAKLLRDGHDDGVETRVLRKCRRRMLGVFLPTRAKRHFRGLDVPEIQSASEKIFENHGWNEIDSRWRVL